MPKPTGTRARRGWVGAGWAATNLALGYLATFPLVTAVVFSYYLRAKIWGTVPAPYHRLEAEVSAVVIVGLGGLLVVASSAINRSLRRKLSGWPALGFWSATVAVQLVPFTWFMLATDRTFPALLGRGWCW